MKLALELDSDRVAAGAPVAGRVVVLGGGESRSLTLTVSFHERTSSYGAVPYSSSSVLHEGDVADGQTFDFDFTLPAESPPSVKGKHAELFWELEARSDRPGFDTRVLRRIEVVAD